MLPGISKADASEWKRLYLALKGLQDDQKQQIHEQIAAYRKWAPSVVKFSFHLGKAFSYASTHPEIRIIQIKLGNQNNEKEYVSIQNFGDTDQKPKGPKKP